MSDLRMDAYYYGFDLTGSREVDEVLSAVAHAGKAFHSTDSWTDAGGYEGVSHLEGRTPAEWIQNAAVRAADRLAKLEELLSRIECKKYPTLVKHSDSEHFDEWRWTPTFEDRQLLEELKGE